LGKSCLEFKGTYSSSQTCWSLQKRKGKYICFCIAIHKWKLSLCTW
jgi:hypothetical protein